MAATDDVELVMGTDPNSAAPLIGYGNIVAHNTVIGADALRGGAIALDRGWHGAPTPHLFKKTVQFVVAEIVDLAGMKRRKVGSWNQSTFNRLKQGPRKGNP